MYIGIDVGGTNIRIASFETLNSSLDKIIKFDTLNNYRKDITNIKKAITNLTDKKPEGIGIGVAAFLDKNNNQIINANNINDWNGKNLKSNLEDIYKCKVLVENDATVAALGEAQFGKGIGLEEFLYITWGTGIGGTFIRRFDKKLLFIPSQPGHQIIEKDGLLCSCGQRGCLEAYCGGWAINKNNQEKIEDYFVLGLINILNIYPVSQIIFGGSIALNQKEKVKRIMESVAENLKMVNIPEFQFSDLGEKAGLLGATVLFSDN